jgi:hypothetical protein
MSAISGTRRQYKEMADGTIRVSVDIEPQFKAEFHRLFPDIDTPVALAPLVLDFERVAEPDPAPANTRPFAQQAKALRLSSFFRSPAVWKAIGSDEDFLAFVRTLKCVAHDNQCGGDIVAAHVRRIADGAGTGIKPDYAAVPMCHAHHHKQHQHGESSIAPKDQWDKWRIETVSEWAWLALKATLGHESWTTLPPGMCRAWARLHDVEIYLPEAYR